MTANRLKTSGIKRKIYKTKIVLIQDIKKKKGKTMECLNINT